jgi:hypothetical protein
VLTGELPQHMITTLLIGFKVGFQNVGEEKEAEDRKQDEEFDQDDRPEFPPHRHGRKALVIKTENASEGVHRIAFSLNPDSPAKLL